MILKDKKIDTSKLPREIRKEDLSSRYREYLTVKELREMLEKYPDDAKILVQRIEDMYFQKYNWGVVFKEGDATRMTREFNEKLRDGTLSNKEEYPELESERYRETTEEEMRIYHEQYHPVWCVVEYPNDENLYLDLHY